MTSAAVDSSDLIEAASRLEPLPSSVGRLIELANDADGRVTEIVEIIAYDPALTVRLLRAANSAASGAAREITTVGDAVVRMGTSTVVALATGAAISPRLQQPALDHGPGELWRHSITAALAVEGIRRVSGRSIPAAASTVALLHDIGKLALAQALDAAQVATILDLAAAESLSTHDAEQLVLATNHTDLGAVAVRAWKLPDVIAESIEAHHSPSAATTPLHHAVAIADCASYDAHSETPRAHLADALGSLQALGLDHTDYGDLVAFAKRRHDELAATFG